MKQPDAPSDEPLGASPPAPSGEPPGRDAARPRDPLHGVTLESLLRQLVDELGWPALGAEVPLRCFLHEPSLGSSLRFLRRTPWARQKVEAIYLRTRRLR